MLRTLVKSTLTDYLPKELINIIFNYQPEMIALCFRGNPYSPSTIVPIVVGRRNKQDDVVCYKAMERQRWKSLVEDVIDQLNNSMVRIIYFDCNYHKSYLDIDSIITSTTVITDTSLVDALERIYPRYLGNDIDVFDVMENGESVIDYDENLCDKRHMWEKDKDQSHKDMIYKARREKFMRENKQ